MRGMQCTLSSCVVHAVRIGETFWYHVKSIAYLVYTHDHAENTARTLQNNIRECVDAFKQLFQGKKTQRLQRAPLYSRRGSLRLPLSCQDNSTN